MKYIVKMEDMPSVEKALKSLTPDEVVEEVKTWTAWSRWSWFPAGMKWSLSIKIRKTKTFSL
jgi:NADH:ubiquinone oxidoreductase subunit F (NADH-binding)